MGAIPAVKVTLSSGKVVILKELKISHTELAAQAAAPRSGDNTQVLQLMMQKELVKILLLKIDEHEPTPNEKEDMDNLFTFQEYGQVASVIGQMSGSGDKVGKPSPLEVVSYGGK